MSENDINYVAGRRSECNLKIALANLYLYHVIAHVHEIKVINDKNESEDPDEQIMREIEDYGGVKEAECCAFRKVVVDQLPFHRMDAMYDRLDFVFEYMAHAEEDKVKTWLARYPNTLPMTGDDIPF